MREAIASEIIGVVRGASRAINDASVSINVIFDLRYPILLYHFKIDSSASNTEDSKSYPANV